MTRNNKTKTFHAKRGISSSIQIMKIATNLTMKRKTIQTMKRTTNLKKKRKTKI